MAAISFRSVGKTVEQTTQEAAVTASPQPIGIKTPLRFGSNSEGVFAMHYSLADQLHDNLRNLILTNWGERVVLYNFGANLQELVTEFVNKDNFDGEAIQRIANAINLWMPYVQPDQYESFVDNESNEHTAVIRLRISYNIPLLNIVGKVLEVSFYVIG